MDAQEIEKSSYPSSPVGSHIDSFKVKERTTDEIGCEEASQSSINEFGHCNGTFLTGFFNVVCVVAGTGTLGLPRKNHIRYVKTFYSVYYRCTCHWWLAWYSYHDTCIPHVCL